MAYRVSTHADGGKRWWQPGENIPLNGPLSETLDIRTATMAEEEVIDEILAQDATGREPDGALGKRIGELMALTP